MNEKEFRKLKRSELVELIYQLEKEKLLILMEMYRKEMLI